MDWFATLVLLDGETVDYRSVEFEGSSGLLSTEIDAVDMVYLVVTPSSARQRSGETFDYEYVVELIPAETTSVPVSLGDVEATGVGGGCSHAPSEASSQGLAAAAALLLLGWLPGRRRSDDR